MESLKFNLGPPCQTLFCPVGGPPLEQPYGHFWGGLPAGRTVSGRLLFPWIPHARQACASTLPRQHSRPIYHWCTCKFKRLWPEILKFSLKTNLSCKRPCETHLKSFVFLGFEIFCVCGQLGRWWMTTEPVRDWERDTATNFWIPFISRQNMESYVYGVGWPRG
jgi:hypothetical protein